MNISWVNLDRHSLKFIYAKNTLNEVSEKHTTRVLHAVRFWPC